MSKKVIKHELRQSISKLLDNLGKGLVDPVPYDTAWVARIPEAQNLGRPAFPLSLQWLRVHQLENGSWGADKPFSAHSSTLNTLAATITLAQWNNPEDEDRIERGIGALWDIAPRLQSGKYAGVSFELILSALKNEAHHFGLSIPYEYYKMYDRQGKIKLNHIMKELDKRTEQRCCKPSTWWHSLEILGHGSESFLKENVLQFSLSMLAESGSVAESPSATAYILRDQRLKGVDIPEAENYLGKVYSLQRGGIPHLFPKDIFELAFSLDFFIKAGFSMKNPKLKEAVHRLSERYNQQKNKGVPSNLEVPESDDMVVALYVLHRAGYDVSIDHVLRVFNETHIPTFLSESNPSASANINALSTLRIFEDTEEVNAVIQKVLTSLETLATSQEQVFIQDKSHSSPYYCTSLAVFNLIGLKDDIVKQCLNFFVQRQNNDGGWGNSFSTVEETAYVVLALCYGLKHDYLIPENVFQRAYAFLFGSQCNSDAQLWVRKVLYRPPLVAESAVLAARYALIKCLQVISIRSTLKEIKPDFIEVELKYEGNQQGCRGTMLCTESDIVLDTFSDQISKVREQVIEKLMEIKLIKGSSKIVVESLVPEGSHFTIRKNNISDEYLFYHAISTLAFQIYDDIVDKNLQLFKDNPNILKLASRVFLGILKGSYGDIDKIESLEFPGFVPLCKIFQIVRLGIIDKPNTNEYLRAIETIFSYFVKDIDNRIHDLSVSSEQFLEIGKITSGFPHFFILQCMFEGVDLSYLKENKLFDKFLDNAAKATRLTLDIFSFPRDANAKCPLENYVLVKQTELKCSVEDAFCATVNLLNMLKINMIDLKREMQKDPSLKDDQNVLKAISVAESVVHGSLDWASNVRRYSQKTENVILKTRKQFKDVNLSEFLRLYCD